MFCETQPQEAMHKLGMRPVPGVMRLSVKKSGHVLFVIYRPDGTYVVFGEAETEDSGMNVSYVSLKNQIHAVASINSCVLQRRSIILASWLYFLAFIFSSRFNVSWLICRNDNYLQVESTISFLHRSR